MWLSNLLVRWLGQAAVDDPMLHVPPKGKHRVWERSSRSTSARFGPGMLRSTTAR
jgi:hypothetical protein